MASMFSLALQNISVTCFGIRDSPSLNLAEMYSSSMLSSGMNDATLGGGDISSWILFPRSSSTP